MTKILNVKLIHETSKGTRIKSPATIQFENGRIIFLKSPFSLKNEIKAMQESKWHGFEDENPRKIWSVEDTPRNRFQLRYMMGEDVYAWFDQEPRQHEFPEKYADVLWEHQKEGINNWLTYHYHVFGYEMSLGKTLMAITGIHVSGKKNWWWAGPKKTLPAMRLEFKKWGLDSSINIELMTYERLATIMDQWKPGDPIPDGFVGDEASRLCNFFTQRSSGVYMLANLIREQYGMEGYVLLMSGTPSPKNPTKWWSLAEITWPGFLREGSPKEMERRMAFIELSDHVPGRMVNQRIAWKDNEARCNVCGEFNEDGPHQFDDDEYHAWQPSKNEVAYLHERLKGLVTAKFKKDCLDLPDKHYRKIYCKPNASTLRLARAISASSPTAIEAMTCLRELSDGFQYRDIEDGTTRCRHCEGGKVSEWFDPQDENRTFQSVDMLNEELVARLEARSVDCPKCGGACEVTKWKRIAKQIPCPKEGAVRMLLEECQDAGRIVLFAGFTGSIDRLVTVCLKEGWAVVRCDQSAYQVFDAEGKRLTDVEGLEYWEDQENNEKVAFVANQESGGFGLNLQQAPMAVNVSNSFKPEYRTQAEDRIHRPGMDYNRGATIVDLFHLPTDERVYQVIKENRRLEVMTMGEVRDALEDGLSEDDYEIYEE